MQKCRYVPKLVEIDGRKDTMIKRVINKSINQEQ